MHQIIKNMKHILTALLLTTSATLFAQNTLEVPSAVQSAFSSLYPVGTAATWQMESKNFVAHFSSRDKIMDAVFSPEAKWLETRMDIGTNEIPEVVKANAINGHAGFVIASSHFINGTDFGYYRLTMQNATGSTFEINYNRDGTERAANNTH